MFDVVTAAYLGFKLLLLDATGLSRDALHIHIGLAILFAVRLVWQGKRGWLVAWLATLGFCLAGEVFDWHSEDLRGADVPLAAHWHDVWNTMLWPSLLALTGCWLMRQRAGEPEPASEPKPSSENAEQPLEQA